jgi:uncharacterized membrane protein HdeD (DUF308 family)
MAHEGSGSSAGRLPWWVTALAGLVCAAVGVSLTFRPFTSLSVLVLIVGIAMVATGVGKLTDEPAVGRTIDDRLAGAAWIVGGIVALGRPDLTTRGVALIAGISMILGGVLDVLSGIRGSTDERLAAIIWGRRQRRLRSPGPGLARCHAPRRGCVFGIRTVVFGGPPPARR